MSPAIDREPTASGADGLDYEAFFAAAVPKLRAYAIRLGWADGAPALVQDAMLVCFDNWEQLHSSFWGRFAHAKDELIRGAARRLKHTSRDHRSLATAADLYAAQNDRMSEAEMIAEKLTLWQRMVLTLSFDGYSPAEIAQLGQIREKTVLNHLFEARRTVARHWSGMEQV